MTPIRWLGLALGSILFCAVFLRFRRARGRRADLVLGGLLAVFLISVSIHPALVTVLRDVLALSDSQFSRLIAILILSNVGLWLLVLYTRYRWGAYREQFDRLVRRLGLQEFRDAYPEVTELAPILVCIPAFNEEQNLGHVLTGMPQAIDGWAVTTLVIDDGSEDSTVEVARKSGALVARNPINRGGGAALRLGFDVARHLGCSIVVTLDADGQHLPAEMTRLVEPIVKNQLDVVIGSRLLGHREKDSRFRLLGIHVFNAAIRVLSTVRLSDCSNGYRAFRVATLETLALQEDQFHASELIIQAAKKGARIGEVPVTVKRRLSGMSKKGRDLAYGFAFARAIIKAWWR